MNVSGDERPDLSDMAPLSQPQSPPISPASSSSADEVVDLGDEAPLSPSQSPPPPPPSPPPPCGVLMEVYDGSNSDDALELAEAALRVDFHARGSSFVDKV